MFRSKQEVDRHVTNILGRIRDEKERNSRGYQIAKLYYDVREFEQAKRYLSAFLSIRESVPAAHKLLGQIMEATNDKVKAIAAYKRSLELDDKQKDLVLKVCEMYCQTDIDPERAQYWVERAEVLFPKNASVFELKEKIIQSESQDSFKDHENLILSELVKRPTDAQLHLRLLKLYVGAGKVSEAYNHAVEVDRKQAFTESLEWYQYLAELYQTYQEANKCVGDIGFFTEKLMTLCNLVMLQLQGKEVLDCVSSLHILDQTLQEAITIPKQKSDWEAILQEAEGQFFFLAGTLLFKRAQKSQLSWRDAGSMAAACYLLSSHYGALDIRSQWYVQAKPDRLQFYDRLHKISCNRLMQGGHLILGLSRGASTHWALDIRQTHCTPQGRERLYDTLFTQRNMRNLKEKSYLMKGSPYCNATVSYPSQDQLAQYETVAAQLQVENLHHLVWIALQHYTVKDDSQPSYNFTLFPNLQFSSKSIHNGTSDSLCQLDAQAFMYMTVRCTAIKLAERQRIYNYDSDQPHLLPSCLCMQLTTSGQAEWWRAVYSFYTNTAKENFGKLRSILHRGLETVRLIGHHGLTVGLIVHLAKTFEEQASALSASLLEGDGSESKMVAVDDRAHHYWKASQDLLHRLQKNQSIFKPKESLFVDDTNLSHNEVKEMVEMADFSLATADMKTGNYEEAIKGYEKLQKPAAAYHIAQIYKTMADNDIANQSQSDAISTEQTKSQILLTKARDSLYLTMDRLRGDKQHELNKLVAADLDDIETRLTKSCLDGSLLGEMSATGFNSPEKHLELDQMNSTEQITRQLSTSTPRLKGRSQFTMPERVVPSPDRLDAQIRSLSLSQEMLLKMVIEKNDELVKINKTLVDELKENRQVVNQIKDLLQNQSRPPPPVLPAPYVASQASPTTSYLMGAPLRPPGLSHYPQPAGFVPPYGYQMPSPGQLPPNYRFPTQRAATRQGLLQQAGLYNKLVVQSEEAYNVGELGEEEVPEEMYLNEGDYYEDDGSQMAARYLVPDSQINQEWPFGHKTGIEGKSTVTYSPQTRPAVPQPNYFSAAVLRGQSLQYGYQQQVPTAPMPMPGPGFFSSPQTQSPVFQNVGGSQPNSALLTALSTKSPVSTSNIPPSTGTVPTGLVGGSHGPGGTMTNPVEREDAAYPGAIPVIGPKAPTALIPAASQQKPTIVVPQIPTATAPQATIALIFVAKASLIQATGKQLPGSIKIVIFTQDKRAKIIMDVGPQEILINQDITKDITIGTQMFMPEFVSWSRMVVAGGESKEEKYSVKFETGDAAQKFKQAIEKVKELVSGTGAKKAEMTPTSTQAGATQSPKQPSLLLSALTSNDDATQKPSQPTQPSNKASFGGFSFSGTPNITPADKKEGDNPSPKKDAAAGQPKPFSGFSFTKPVAGNPGSPSTGNLQTAFSAPSAGTPIPSFGSPTIGFQKATSPGFKGSPSKVFPGSPLKGKEERVEEYEPNVDFKPVVPLPALVDTKTGEEEEEKLFGERCKLFRFDADNNQWKERGVGEMKLLRHQATKRVRVLMRREQVLKLCANHYISSDMKLVPMPTSDKAWCWNAADYSEEEMKCERLAVRFKTVDQAANFKQTFEKCLAALDNESKTIALGKPQSKGEGKVNAFSNKFAPKEGSWECSGCLVRNNADINRCPACQMMKPGTKPEDAKGEKQSGIFGLKPAASGFKFTPQATSDKSTEASGSTKATLASNKAPGTPKVTTTDKPKDGSRETELLSEMFKPNAGMWECDGCYIQNEASVDKCPACNTLKPGTKSDEKKDDGEKKLFGFVSKPSGFSFLTEEPTTSSSGFKFGVPSSTDSKASTGGGFVFGTQTTTAAEKTSSTATKTTSLFENVTGPSLFGNTTTSTTVSSPFGKPSSNVASLSGSPVVTSTPSLFGSTPPASAISVSGSSSTPVFIIAKANDPSWFGSTSTPEFSFSLTPSRSVPSKGPTTPKSPEDEGSFYLNKEDDDSHIYFEPVVPLPDKVDVKTGEEDEITLFEYRSKLYRFDKSEWKERGLGIIKLLEHKTTKRIRLLMRREQVLKICCNHYINEEISLEPMSKSDGKAWVWFATDFTETEPQHEQFAIKFKTAQIANQFKAAIDDAKKKLASVDDDVDSRKACDTTERRPSVKEMAAVFEEPVITSSTANVTGDTGNRFRSAELDKAASEAPDIESIVSSSPDIESIVSSSPAKITGDKGNRYRSSELDKAASVVSSSYTDDEVLYLYESKPTPEQVEMARKYQLPDNFYLYELRKPCSGCRGCDDYDSAKSPVVIGKEKSKVSVSDIKPEEPDSTDSSAPVMTFGAASLSSFSSLAADVESTPFAASKDSGFAWSGAGKQLFSSGAAETEDAGDDTDVMHDNDVHFEPIVPLPSLVEVKTGEEEEDVVFSQRAKLFRFDKDTSQWKEKGLGEMKILKHRTEVRYRLLLRREQVFKLACNHSLTSDLQFSQLLTSETSWCWTTLDYTESEPRIEQFAIRFKNVDLAQQFKMKVDECQEALRSAPPAPCITADAVSDATVTSTTSGGFHPNQDDDDNDEDYEDIDTEDDEEETLDIMFEKRITFFRKDDNMWKNLGMGDIKVRYDEDVNGNRIVMVSDDAEEDLCNHLVARESRIVCDKKKKMCEWSPIDFATNEPVRQTYRAQFSSSSAAEEFANFFEQVNLDKDQGRQLAIESDISERGMFPTQEMSFPMIATGQKTTGQYPAPIQTSIGESSTQASGISCSPEITSALDQLLKDTDQ